jgi:hypothetical protein|tara:strand:+ start:12730 stop:12954 length:225 start_codon:yes stop_codon:yes gene_type:complete
MKKLICIKPGDPLNGLIKDKEYTELERYENAMGEDVIEVLEAMPPAPFQGYQAWRFAEVKPNKVQEKVEELEAT